MARRCFGPKSSFAKAWYLIAAKVHELIFLFGSKVLIVVLIWPESVLEV